jgi:type IV pilus assembly protein PilC
MPSASTATAEFYYQLALLLRSGLPLPDSLRQLAPGIDVPGLKRLVEDAGEQTAAGTALSEALGRHPRTFDPFLVRMVEIGEQTESLPVMLLTVAQLARFEQFLVASLRSILAYPLLAIHLALLVAIGASFYILPHFASVVGEMMSWTLVPALTRAVFYAGDLICRAGPVVVALYLVFLAFSVWLFSPVRSAHRAMVFFVNVMPGTWRISGTLDAARMSQMLGNLMQRRVPASEALHFAGSMVSGPPLAAALHRCADDVERGTPFKEAVANQAEVDRLVRLTVEHCPEDQLPSELVSLGELYEHRVMLSVKTASAAWTVVVLVAAIVAVSTVVISMFLPLVQIVGALSGA